MAAENSELAVIGLVLLIMILIFALVWFVFMVPMEKGLHKRRMELVQKRLQQNEERLKREALERGRQEREEHEQHLRGQQSRNRRVGTGG